MQRGLMATSFFLMAHDPFTGKLQISDELLGCGVVGAELADLIISRRLDIVDGRIVANEQPSRTGDRVADYVVESVGQQPQAHVVRTWCENLADPLRDMLVRRLTGDGVLRREQRRRGDRYPAVDLLKAAGPKLRLEHALRTPKDLDLASGFTAALVWTLGVERILELHTERAAARDLVTTQVYDLLPTSLQELLQGLRLAVAAVSLRVRR